MKNILMLVILISLLLISCSKTTRIAENENWYLEEETNLFGKPVEHSIYSQFNIHHHGGIFLVFNKEYSVVFVNYDLGAESSVDKEIEFTFDNTKPFKLKYDSEYLSAWDSNRKPAEYDLLMENFLTKDKVMVQGVGCTDFSIYDLWGFNEIYKEYVLRQIMNEND